jgi:hypothetical protein
MPASKKRKPRSGSPACGQPHRTKALYLPMPQAEADQIMLMSRLALEAVRCGRADGPQFRCLGSVVLLTRYLTEAGQGLLDPAVIDEVEYTLGDAIRTSDQSGVWTIPANAIDALAHCQRARAPVARNLSAGRLAGQRLA